MRKKGKTRIIAIAAILMTVGTATLMTANAAGNIQNTDFEYTWTQEDDKWTDMTVGRAKWDYSSAMMACRTGPNYVAKVYAQYIDGSLYVDCSRGHSYAFTANSSTYMLNWVREEGFGLCAIGGELSSASNKNIPATGFWSPDSI